MKIGIIGAMDEEIQYLIAQLSNIKKKEVAKQSFTIGKFRNHEIIILKCGIGKVNAAVGTSLLLNLYRPDYVINTGVAGGLSPSINVGDIVISSEVRYHDVDLTIFGYEFGQMAAMPASFLPHNDLLEITQKCIVNTTQNKTIKGLIVSGDSFVNNLNQSSQIKTKFKSACAVEMEACAIAHVCHLFAIPFIIIRSISDTPDFQNSAESFKQFLTMAANKSAKLVLSILKEIK